MVDILLKYDLKHVKPRCICGTINILTSSVLYFRRTHPRIVVDSTREIYTVNFIVRQIAARKKKHRYVLNMRLGVSVGMDGLDKGNVLDN